MPTSTSLSGPAGSSKSTPRTGARKRDPSPDDDNARPLKRPATSMNDQGPQIPLDVGCQAAGLGRYHVYVDDNGVAFDAFLQNTATGNTGAKFFLLQILQIETHFVLWERAGPIGKFGQSVVAKKGTAAQCVSLFKTHFREKTGLSWDSRNSTALKSKYAYKPRAN